MRSGEGVGRVTSKTWAGPVLLSLLLVAYLVIVGRQSADSAGGAAGGLMVDFAGREVPFGVSAGIRSARTAVSDSRWVEGSSRVLPDLSACLEAASVYRQPVLVSQGVEDPVHATDPTDVFEYYRDVCLNRVGRQAWIGFVRSYGERPRAWVLQLLASAENEYDRLRLEPGVSADEAWNEAFRDVPTHVDALRRHLLAVYSLAAAGAEPSGESPPDVP